MKNNYLILSVVLIWVQIVKFIVINCFEMNVAS